jgi:hypothetical protein
LLALSLPSPLSLQAPAAGLLELLLGRLARIPLDQSRPAYHGGRRQKPDNQDRHATAHDQLVPDLSEGRLSRAGDAQDTPARNAGTDQGAHDRQGRCCRDPD